MISVFIRIIRIIILSIIVQPCLSVTFSPLISKIQVTKKEKPELLKTVTITPSESTHFRVILSSEAMEDEAELERGDVASSSVCTIVKPEPRTPITTVTPVSPLATVGTITSESPVTATEPLDVLPSNVATSTPFSSGQSDSPSKKKGKFGGYQLLLFSALNAHLTDK